MKNQEQAGRANIRTFVEHNMTVFDDDAELEDGTDIFSSGYVNSIFAMRLLQFLEREFAIEIPDDDIQLTNFSSVDAMWTLVERLQEVNHAF